MTKKPAPSASATPPLPDRGGCFVLENGQLTPAPDTASNAPSIPPETAAEPGAETEV